jgi:AcrR family transcriptional regulator
VPKSGRSQSLTREEIIDAALGLIRTHGLPGLTMRAVAAELGVTPMAVYYYVADKDELVRLVAETISVSRGPLRLGEGGWEESLRRYLLRVWEESTRYPGLGTYLINQPTLGVTPESLQDGIQFFEQAGFSPAAARLAWSFSMTYIHGRISVDAHLATEPGAPRLEGLHARDYVAFGVDSVIAGLRQALDPDRGAVPRQRRNGQKSTALPNP